MEFYVNITSIAIVSHIGFFYEISKIIIATIATTIIYE